MLPLTHYVNSITSNDCFRGEQTLPDADDPGAVLLAGAAGCAGLHHLGTSEPAVRHAGSGKRQSVRGFSVGGLCKTRVRTAAHFSGLLDLILIFKRI